MRPEFSSDPADGAQGPGQTQISHLLPALDLLISGDLSRACHTEASSLLSETVQLSVLNPANVSMGIAFLYACLTFVMHFLCHLKCRLVVVVGGLVNGVGLFCNRVSYSLPGYSVRGILQARVLEWAAISSSRGSSLHLLHLLAGSLLIHLGSLMECEGCSPLTFAFRC